MTVPLGSVRTGRSRLAIRPWAALPPGFILQLVELERRVHKSSPHYDDAPWQLRHFAQVLPGKHELSAAAVAGGSAVGFLVASRKPASVHVHRLAVDPDRWGTGIASTLLARLLAQSDHVVTLNCDPQNQRALAFYVRAGFQVTATTPAGKLQLSAEGPGSQEEI